MDRVQRDVQAGSSGHPAGPTEVFVRELTAHQSRLKGLIRCLLFDPKDVEDVWQDTNVLLIKKAAEFRPGTDFWAWSSAVARYQVLTHCKKQKRSRLLFSTDTLETLAADFDLVRDQVDPRRDALQSCLAQLPLPQRQLLELRYGCLRLSRSMTRRLPLTPAGSCGGCPPRPARRATPGTASFFRSFGQPRVGAISIPRTNGPVEVDGQLDEWPSEPAFRATRAADGSEPDRLEGWMLYDPTALYIAARVGDPHPLRNAVDPAQRLETLWHGGALQLFLSLDRALGWPAKGGDAVFTQSIPLDAAGRGYGRFTLPALAKGTYRVEYDLGGGRVIRSNRPFTRTFFEFEGNDIGEIHDVFAPFTPVEVEGRTVAVVDRRYTLNPQGLFERMVAKDRELLAEPMRLVVELADGRQVEWKPAGQAGGVAGRAPHPDTAVFQCAARGDGLGLESRVTIEEDGCAKVEMQLGPDAAGGKGVAIRRAWLRMALKESEAPLCHMVGLNSMRHNYAGQRGIQRLQIEPGKVVLHVELIQQPVTLVTPRTFVFGLQGSPTKPMMDGWRGYAVPGGGGMSVVVWGGYNCASHYLDPKDWRIVEKIVSARDPEVNKNVWKGPFKEFFETLDTQRQFPDLKVFGREDWLKNVLGFASRSRRSPNGITVYYEEFQTSGLHPETYEYMDEWDLGSWCRFRKFNFEGKPYPDSRGWGPEARTANQKSWRDFAVYYADEWMKRGVGIYYDNTMPHTDFNRFTLRDPGVDWQSCLWGHRDYFRRVWKRSRELMAKGLTPIDPYDPANPRPMRLHIVGHVTNCQVLPYTTWWDATLGVESPGQWLPDTIPPRSPEEQQRIDKRGYVVLGGPSKDNPGQALPYPPDYLRAMEMGRMAGLISHSRHSLRSDDAFGGLGVGYGSTDKPPEDVAYHRRLSDKAMNLVHEIRGGGSPYDHDDIRTVMAAFELFGYGQPETTVHNYWEERPFLTVVNPAIKWIALERRPAAGPGEPVLALLQSYDAEACSTRLDLPKGTAVLDLFTRQLSPASEPLHFAADYGTRLVLLGDRGRLASLAWGEGVVLRGDFELGLPPGWKSRGAAAPQIVADPQDSANHVLRITPAHPSQHFVSGETAGDETLSLRFRLPALTEKPPYPQFYGMLQLLKRQVGGWPKQSGQMLQVGIQNNKDGTPALALTYTTRREGTIEPFANVTADRLTETGTLIRLDDAWHTLSVTVVGTRHTLAIDGVELFSGETDVTDGGALVIGPGWGSWSPGFIDIDELVVRR